MSVLSVTGLYCRHFVARTRGQGVLHSLNEAAFGGLQGSCALFCLKELRRTLPCESTPLVRPGHLERYSSVANLA